MACYLDNSFFHGFYGMRLPQRVCDKMSIPILWDPRGDKQFDANSNKPW